MKVMMFLAMTFTVGSSGTILCPPGSVPAGPLNDIPSMCLVLDDIDAIKMQSLERDFLIQDLPDSLNLDQFEF